MNNFKKWFAARARNPDKITLEEAFNAGVSAQQRSQPAPSVPAGWKLVPLEPTPGMIDAAEYVDWGDADVRGSCINAWDRMLAAAPKMEAKPCP